MTRRIDFYRIKRNDNLASIDFWNQRFDDLDLRLSLREADADRIDEAVETLEAVALQRLDDTFTPLILEAQERLESLGVSFEGESATSNSIATGEKTFTLSTETAERFVYIDYVTIRSQSSPTNSMLAEVVSFVRETGVLSVDVVSVVGSGTFTDWIIRVGVPPDATHADRTDNPHSVTAAQVGAYTTAQVIALLDALETELRAEIPQSSGDMLKSENLSGLTNYTQARSNLGLGSFATRNVATAEQTVSDAASIIWNLLSQPFNVAKVTLGGNRTMANPTGMHVGFHVLKVIQPASGGPWDITSWGSAWRFPGGVKPVLSTAANAVDTFSFVCDGAAMHGTWMNDTKVVT